jgi:prevent-host-death family protein
MRTAGVAELKARLSSYLDKVKAGQEVVVTHHGVPVARIVPLESNERRDRRRERLIRAGLLVPARKRLARLLSTPPRGPLVGGSVVEALVEERGEGR